MDTDRLLEDRTHGDTMFPLKVYTVDNLDGEVIFKCHWHHEAEFIYMEKGEAVFQIGTPLITLREGEALFIPSGQLHAAYPLEGSAFTFHAIVFHLHLLNSFEYDAIQSKYMELLKDPETTLPALIQQNSSWEKNVLKSLLKIIHQYEKKEPAFELAIKAQLFLLMSEIMKNNPVQSKIKESTDLVKINRLKTVLGYIDHHYSSKLNICDLASMVQMSEGHFSRFFKSLVRMTPIEYINTVRVNHAAKLLKKTNRKIIEISMEVGFDSPSYFIKTFKKQKRCTPSDFRKTL